MFLFFLLSHLDRSWAAPLPPPESIRCLRLAPVACRLPWSRSIRTSFPVRKDVAINKTDLQFLLDGAGRVLTKAGTTSLRGFGDSYLWAFLAANFSVGIDFPAILNLRPSTCLQTDAHLAKQKNPKSYYFCVISSGNILLGETAKCYKIQKETSTFRRFFIYCSIIVTLI